MKNKISNLIKKVDLLLFLCCVIAAVYFVLNYRIYIVASGSMQPTLNVNDMIVVKINNEKSIYNEGDIITYYYPKEDIYITHRITKVLDEGYYTKGDFNNINDLDIVSNDQIVGKMIYHSLFLGNLFVKYKFIMLFLIIIFIILCDLLVYLKNSSSKEEKVA